MHTDWNKVIDVIQKVLIWFVILLVAVCTATLILFDVLAGTGIDFYLTQGNLKASVVISMATTGLLMALMFIGYTLMKRQSQVLKKVGTVLAVIAGLVFCVDIVFDSLTADILSFGQVTDLSAVPNAWVHWLFRFLLGGMSLVGEALALAIIMGMPVLKEMIGDALPNYPTGTYRPPQNARTQTQQTYRTATSVPDGLRNSAYNTAYNARPSPKPAPKPVQTTFIPPEPTYHPVSQ